MPRQAAHGSRAERNTALVSSAPSNLTNEPVLGSRARRMRFHFLRNIPYLTYTWLLIITNKPDPVHHYVSQRYNNNLT